MSVFGAFPLLGVVDADSIPDKLVIGDRDVRSLEVDAVVAGRAVPRTGKADRNRRKDPKFSMVILLLPIASIIVTFKT